MYSASALANALSVFEMINKTVDGGKNSGEKETMSPGSKLHRLHQHHHHHHQHQQQINSNAHHQLLMLAQKELQAFYANQELMAKCDKEALLATLKSNPSLLGTFSGAGNSLLKSNITTKQTKQLKLSGEECKRNRKRSRSTSPVVDEENKSPIITPPPSTSSTPSPPPTQSPSDSKSPTPTPTTTTTSQAKQSSHSDTESNEISKCIPVNKLSSKGFSVRDILQLPNKADDECQRAISPTSTSSPIPNTNTPTQTQHKSTNNRNSSEQTGEQPIVTPVQSTSTTDSTNGAVATTSTTFPSPSLPTTVVPSTFYYNPVSAGATETYPYSRYFGAGSESNPFLGPSAFGPYSSALGKQKSSL